MAKMRVRERQEVGEFVGEFGGVTAMMMVCDKHREGMWGGEEEEEEAVFISVVNRRRRWWSLLVKFEGDPLNTQHAQHRPVQATDR